MQAKRVAKRAAIAANLAAAVDFPPLEIDVPNVKAAVIAAKAAFVAEAEVAKAEAIVAAALKAQRKRNAEAA